MNKKYFIGLLPYGIVRLYQKQKGTSVSNTIHPMQIEYQNYLSKGQYCSFVEDSPFQTIVSVQGFGYSGSGAIVDLLREYESVLVIGNVDLEGASSSSALRFEEMNILRLSGGLFEVEKYLGTNNIYQNDALLHRLINLIESSEIYTKYEKSSLYFCEFLRRISIIYTNSTSKQVYNRHLQYGGFNDVLLLKELSVQTYRTICRGLLNTLFTLLKGNTNATILVMDQLVNDREYDMERYLDYIPNLKMIAVYRDPRDVFAFAQREKIEWIPYASVEEFIQWYRIITKHFCSTEKKSYLAVSFEHLLNNYDEEVRDIEKYVGLNNTLHVRKKEFLDVSVSKKNMFLWMKSVYDQTQYSVIQNALPQLCYNFENSLPA